MGIVEIRNGSAVIGQFTGEGDAFLVNEVVNAISRRYKGKPMELKTITVISNDIGLLDWLRQSPLQCRIQELLKEIGIETPSLIKWSLRTNLKPTKNKD